MQQNFNDFLENRMPGGIYEDEGPSKFVIMRSDRIKKEHSKDKTRDSVPDEWVEYEDPMAPKPDKRRFWYNTRTKQYRYARPRIQDITEYDAMKQELNEMLAKREEHRKAKAQAETFEKLLASGVAESTDVLPGLQ